VPAVSLKFILIIYFHIRSGLLFDMRIDVSVVLRNEGIHDGAKMIAETDVQNNRRRVLN
jgi:hypothetical protein